jgi:hypothetical protein
VLNTDQKIEFSILAIMVAAVVLVCGAIFCTASYEAKHPCTKYGKKETCIQPGYFIQVDKSMVWMPEQQ